MQREQVIAEAPPARHVGSSSRRSIRCMKRRSICRMRRRSLRSLAAAVALTASMASPAVVGAAEEEVVGWPEEYPRFRWWEYVGTASLLGGSLAVRFAVDISGEPNWKSGLPGDDAIYDAFFIRTPHRFQNWRKLGDIGYLSAYAWSAADPLIAAVVYDWDAALQMTLMNLEAFSVYSMILSVSQMIIRRERPSTRECADPALADALGVSCTSENVNRAFIGGHAGTVATAATLTCLHHIHLPLWGDAGADALPCVFWTAATFAVASSRTVTGQHNLSDNILGVGAGVVSGLVPWALHYAQPRWEGRPFARARPPRLRPTAIAVTPEDEGLSLHVTGVVF
jgi:hypothetical protein